MCYSVSMSARILPVAPIARLVPPARTERERLNANERARLTAHALASDPRGSFRSPRVYLAAADGATLAAPGLASGAGVGSVVRARKIALSGASSPSVLVTLPTRIAATR